MIGHQILLGLNKESYLIHAHFKNKKSKQSYLKSINTIFHYIELTETNITEFLININPEIIINAAGITIRKLEQFSLKQIIFINSLLPNILNDWCEQNNAKLIHFSTDCVFSGYKGNYLETDKTDAIDLYGKTKSLGEVKSENCITLRSSMIGFELYNKTELLEWIFKNQNKSINGFSNVIYSGITTTLMSKIIIKIITDFPNLTGLYNISSSPISKYYLLKKINTIFNLNTEIKAIESNSSNKSLLYDSFLNKTKIEIPDWDTMLNELKNTWLLNKHIYEN